MNIRTDLKIIANLIRPKSCVLDIGCGEGDLLQYLRDEKQIDGRGIDSSQVNVAKCLERGLSVIHGDAEKDLSDYPDQNFDYAILSQVLQATKDPKKILQEMLRVAKYAIVALPNFAYFQNRFHLAFKGTMPVNKFIPFEWYETPNIHFCSIKDFENLCHTLNFSIDQEIFISKNFVFPNFAGRIFANLFAEYGIFCLSKKEFIANIQEVFVVDKNPFFMQKNLPRFASFNKS